MRRLTGMLAAALVAGAMTLTGATPASADGSFTIEGASQVTGMTSDVTRGAYWTSDEAGGKVTAVTAAGMAINEVRYSTRTESVQALSLAKGVLYVGDIGGQRSVVTVLRLSSLSGGETGTTGWRLRYPDGEHEAKAMAVSPRGNIYIVTDGDKPAVYRMPPAPSTRGTTTLLRVADAPKGVTDATFLPGGSTVALRTHDQVIVLDAYEWRVKGSAYVLEQPNGEAIALDLDGQGLVLSNGAQAVKADVPTGVSTRRPTPSRTPEPTPTASSKPTVSPVPADQERNAASLWGTFAALAAALVVAVVAGLVVAVKK